MSPSNLIKPNHMLKADPQGTGIGRCSAHEGGAVMNGTRVPLGKSSLALPPGEDAARRLSTDQEAPLTRHQNLCAPSDVQPSDDEKYYLAPIPLGCGVLSSWPQWTRWQVTTPTFSFLLCQQE